MSKRVNKLGVDFPSCEGLVSIDHDFPTIQFDHKLVAKLLPGEVVDVSEESLKKYLRYAEIPEDRWGDLSLTITGAKNSLYLKSKELGYVENDDGGKKFNMVVGIDYCRNSDIMLQNELCYVKDRIDGKLDLHKKNSLYGLGGLVSRERFCKQAIIAHALGALAYACGMHFNIEEVKEGVIYTLATADTLAAASLGAYLKGYRHDPGEECVRGVAEEDGWSHHVFNRRIDATSTSESSVSLFLSHPWTSVQIVKDNNRVDAMKQAANQLGLSCYETIDPDEIKLLINKQAKREYFQDRHLQKIGLIRREEGSKRLTTRRITDILMKDVDVALQGGGAVVAVVPDSIRSIGLGEFHKRYDDIKRGFAE